MGKSKIRLDVYLSNKEESISRQRAKALIMEGRVFINGQRACKAGTQVANDDRIDVVFSDPRYVSRGGFKLEKALDVFGLNLNGKVCLDVGASTGGFTDCMLQDDAKLVYTVDCGINQLAWEIRNNRRVRALERTNFRYCTEKQIPEKVDFASVDVSFISLRLILPVLYEFMKPNAYAVCLVKPQFEAGRSQVGKNGIVTNSKTHVEVIEKTAAEALANGFSVLGLDYSPIKGTKGNIEFLMLLKKSDPPQLDDSIDPYEVVKSAHEEL